MLIAIVLNLLIHLTFHGFDTLLNTPLGKCYNGTSMCLRTLVIIRITIWSFLASLLGTKLSIDIKKYQQMLSTKEQAQECIKDTRKST
jgi:hypothetical protein